MGLALMAVSVAVSAAGAYASATAQSNAAKYQAQVAQQNADIAGQKANWQAKSTEQQSADMAQRAKAHMGAIISQQAASGLSTEEGTSKDVQRSQAGLEMASALKHRERSAQEWWAIKSQQTGFQNQKTLDEMQADNAMTMGYIKAGSSLIGGASDINKNYPGMFS
jgi:ParB-like chromosome segregation protein Spo0J